MMNKHKVIYFLVSIVVLLLLLNVVLTLVEPKIEIVEESRSQKNIEVDFELVLKKTLV